MMFFKFLVKGVRIDGGVWLIPWPRSTPRSPRPLWTSRWGGGWWQPSLSTFPCIVRILGLYLVILNADVPVLVVRFIANNVCSKTMR